MYVVNYNFTNINNEIHKIKKFIKKLRFFFKIMIDKSFMFKLMEEYYIYKNLLLIIIFEIF